MKARAARLLIGAVWLLCTGVTGRGAVAGPEVPPHLFVATVDARGGDSAALELVAPWKAQTELEPVVGFEPMVRHFFGLHYVIDGRMGEIQVIDAATFDTLRKFSFGAASEPQDIRVLNPGTAYVTLYNSTRLLKIDPRTGAELGSVDLSHFSDADGFPEMSMMALHGNHLFVQIQRLDRAETGNPVPPSYLAVVDTDTDKLLDAVSLKGTHPRLKMHLDPRARRLFVSAPGPRLDTTGGIEEIDLNTMKSLGLIVTEEQGIGDIGAFTMISPDAGYAVGHTDITESSHLFGFARRVGRTTGELYVTLDIIPSLVFDPISQVLFFPDSGRLPSGIHVFDVRTSDRLTELPVSTGRPPHDMVMARTTTPGEATGVRIARVDPATGTLSIAYRPACGASDHNLVWGRLEELRTLAYFGQACGIGAGGMYDLPDPGPGSYFFLVVGTDGASVEGSYGASSAGDERPEDLVDPLCSFSQDLSFSCDAQ